MSYVPGIPNPIDIPSQSQGQIKTNFTQLNTIFDVDHVTFNAASGKGEHDKITFNNVLGAHAAPVNPKSLLYAKDVAGIPELFFENSALAKALTGLTIVTTTPSATGFGITTPWGLKLNWGEVAFVSPSVSHVVTFQVPFSNTSYVVMATQKNTTPRYASVENPNVNKFTLYSQITSTNVYFFAIGV